MQLPQIRMNSQMAQISIHQARGRQTIRQPKAEMSIQQPKAELSIKTTPSKLNIDQTKAWEDMNLMHIFKRIEEFANEGLQAALEGTARRAEQGTQMMKIENQGSPLIQQAATNAYDQTKSLGIKFIPSPFSVKIDYQPSRVNIDVKANAPHINVEPQKPSFLYERGEVEVGMKNYQNLEIDFIHLFSGTPVNP